MRSTGSVDPLDGAAFAAAGAEGCAARDGAAGRCARRAGAGTRQATPKRTAERSGRLMMAISGRTRGTGTHGFVNDDLGRHIETGEDLGPRGRFYRNR